MITHVETVAVYVSDQDRAVGFFVDQLGFELRKDVPMGSAEDAPRWIEVAPPGAETVLALFTPPGLEDRIGMSSGLVSSVTISMRRLLPSRPEESRSLRSRPNSRRVGGPRSTTPMATSLASAKPTDDVSARE